MKSFVRIGTRGSQLALYQAELVKDLLEKNFPQIRAEIIKIKTSGDMIRRGPGSPLETKRIFTREIEDALLAETIDIAVHSAKDLTVWLPERLQIGAALEREDPRDCLISRDKQKLSQLPLGARIGTSALRRKRQLLKLSPELVVEEIHGNVDTRIRKLESGECDAIVLAYAGVKRLGLTHHVTEIFEEKLFLPAPGQGVIVIECRSGDSGTLEVLRPLNHAPTLVRLECERAFSRRLEGGCQLPCGIMTKLEDHQLHAHGVLFDAEKNEWAEADWSGDSGDPETLGRLLAEKVLEQGGREILERIREASRHGKPLGQSDEE